MKLYCPKCGEKTDMNEWDLLQPGIFTDNCGECGAIWEIDIQFLEINPEVEK